MRGSWGSSLRDVVAAGCSAAVLAVSSPAGAVAAGEASPAAETARQAELAFQARDWPAAARAYESIVASEPTDGRAWYRLGYSLHLLGRYDQAVQAYEKAVALGSNPILTYNLACALARAGQTDRAFEWLDRTIQVAVGDPAAMAADEDLAALRQDSRWSALLARAEKAARPCRTRPESRQFDFWVGDWEVRTPQGDVAGSNLIQLILGDCVLMENWTGRFGSGKSLNVFNPDLGYWTQTWTDDRGGVTEFREGRYGEGAMRFLADVKLPDGRKARRRLTFFNLGPDKVRQLSETTADGGATWSVDYDLTYLRKKT